MRLLPAFAAILAAALLGGGLLALAQTEDRDDEVCIESLSPGKCDQGGDDICYWVYNHGPEQCTSQCWYCPGDDTLPNFFCMPEEGQTCYQDRNDMPICQGANQLKGECVASDGDCKCKNTIDTKNSCAGDLVLPCAP